MKTAPAHTRHENDFYRTPQWCVQGVLATLNGWLPHVDPCAGDGALIDAVEQYAPWTVIRGIEIREGNAAKRIVQGDGLACSWAHQRVIMNPPFAGIEQWLAKIPEAESALVLMRSGVLGGQKRRLWWEAHRPSVIRFLSRRPSFTEDGRTDMYDYAWVGWGIEAEPIGWIA